eukprot:s363_g18.t2
MATHGNKFESEPDGEDVRKHQTPPGTRARKRYARRGSRLRLEDAPDEARDRSSSLGRACTRLRTAVQEYLMYHFWTPLTGLVAVGSAFTVQPWLSICDLVVGIILLHSHIFQVLFKRCGGKCKEVENVLVLAALMLSIVTLIVRIAQTSGREVWFFDVIYLVSTTFACICCVVRSSHHSHNSEAVEFRQVPATPVLLLCLGAATLAPPSLSSLPYALVFLKYGDALLRKAWRRYLTGHSRLGLMFLTTTHIVALLVLNFMSWSNFAIPDAMLGIFGEMGRTTVLFKESITSCISERVASKCMSREASLWPGLHLGCVLLLHFVLTNVEQGQLSTTKFLGPKLVKTASSASSTASSRISGVAARLLRTCIVLILLAFSLAFPSLLTVPIIMMYVWRTFVSASNAEAEVFAQVNHSSGFCRCCRRSTEDKELPVTSSESLDGSGCHTQLGWTRYAAVVFLIFYVYNVLEVFMDSLVPQAAESFTSLRLMILSGPRGIDVVQLFGLNIYRFYEPHSSAAAFLPQACMLLLVALLQAFADGGYTVEVSPWLASLEKHSLNIWVYICRQCPAELPMLVALTIFVMLSSAARGETPAFLVAYALIWGKLVCFKLEVGQPRTWQLLQALAQLGFVLVMLLYLVAPLEHPNNTPPVQLMYKVFPEIKYRQSLLRIVIPHLALALCAYMERLRIAKVAGLRYQGRLRADTLESIDTISSEIDNRSTTYWGTQRNRCLRSIVRYKVLVVAKLRKWADELICIFVLALSFGAALVPGTDIHSLALLLGTGPALLMYNTRGTNRGRKLDCGYLILRFSTVLMFTFRLTAASALIEWPDDRQWPIALGELGVVRPLWDPPMKVLLLGIIPVMARLAIIATIRVQREDADRRDEIIAHWQDQMAEEEANAEVAKEVPIESMAVLEVHASVASPSHSEAYPSEIEAQIPDEHSGHTADPPDAQETVSIQASPRNRRKSSVRFLYEGGHEAEARGESKGRRRENRARGPNMEERLLTWFIPSWMEFMPLNMHVYLSAILLVLVFALSIQEVNVLSFLMMLAVICLCGWSRRWVQAGNVFSCTTLAIMWLQYLARFRIFDDLATSAVWLQRLGLQWKTSQVEKHCAILVVCILQKQYWYRGRFSKVRPVVCPNFVADHADMAGFFGLIAVAVIRRHALSTMLVLGALPWVIREELPFKGSEQRHAHTKWSQPYADGSIPKHQQPWRVTSMAQQGSCNKCNKRTVLCVLTGLSLLGTCYPMRFRTPLEPGTTPEIADKPSVSAEVFAELEKLDPVEEAYKLFVDNGSDVSITRLPMESMESANLVDDLKVQNHIYQHELARGDRNCPYFAEDETLLSSGWNLSRYPWHIVKYRSSISPIKREVLYGTAFAQKTIWEHQHPADCSKIKYMAFYHTPAGIGSQLHLLGQALALAMHLGRILVIPNKDSQRHFEDPTFCPGEAGWHCWFQHITWCKPRGDVLKIYGFPEHGGFKGKDVPEVFHPLLKCSPVKPRFWFYWWRAQSIAYLIRFNQKTRTALDQLRSETLFQCKEHVKAKLLEPGMISAHVRHGFKLWEAKIFEFEDYVEQMDALAAGNQKLRVLYKEVAESNTSFTFPSEAYARRAVFLSTEDPLVVVKALKLCAAKDPWKVIYTKVDRNNKDSWMHVEKRGAARREVMLAMMNLELALEADAWVCTLTSNW